MQATMLCCYPLFSVTFFIAELHVRLRRLSRLLFAPASYRETYYTLRDG